MVEEIIAEFERTILKPLHRSSGEKIRSDLKDELDKILEGCKGLFAMMDVSVERHNLLLEKKGYSSYSALIEAYDPEIVRPIFEDIISKEEEHTSDEDSQKIDITWKDYFEFAYGDFYKNLKKLLPKGPHADFYNKRVLEKNKQQSQTKISKKTDDKSKQYVDKKLLQDAVKHAEKKNAIRNSNLILSKPEDTDKISVPSENFEEKKSQTNPPSKKAVSPSPAPTPRPKVKSNRPDVKSTEPNISVPAYDPKDPSNRELPLPKGKRTEMPSVNYGEGPEIEPKPVQTKPEPPKPKPDPPKPLLEPPKPKKNLLEQMKELASTKQEKATPKSKQISYPPIFTEKNWKKYWSNSSSTKGSVWKQFFWNCNSIGKSYLMKSKGRDKLQREFDVNQDFAIVNPGRGSLRVILFDGVSQSRAPRQWAECLAETFIENKLNIRKLKSHSTEVEDWHTSSIEKWNKWIENHYLPQRQHLPDWRLKNEKNQSFTTFLVIEIDSKMIKLANI